MVPQLHVSYTSCQQTHTFYVVLTDTLRAQLAALPPATPVLAALLQDVRNQMVSTFEFLADGLLTVTSLDLDPFARLFIGIDASKQQKLVKVQLVRVFLPLLAKKLCR